MNKFLIKLFILMEIAIGAFLFMAGLSGFFSYFIFNALLCVIGFFVFIDGVSKIDNPETRKKPDDKDENNEES